MVVATTSSYCDDHLFYYDDENENIVEFMKMRLKNVVQIMECDM